MATIKQQIKHLKRKISTLKSETDALHTLNNDQKYTPLITINQRMVVMLENQIQYKYLLTKRIQYGT